MKFDASFTADYRRVTRRYPCIKRELGDAIRELSEHGELPDSHGAHLLGNPGGSYNGHIDFHLSDGKVDVLALYLPHKTNPEIRFVRMGTHEELFQGSVR
ncbi:type II toxin-antitoxin system YafQ family toxin [Collinsella intestinalis]|uniref:type II toxin-antitoxin system YafQ family toxin n=1 Tax=Collinsella intestinalis TaxID=147207 RepID=UPI00195AF412|nr:type II toxin-antitoxin system YafQ family toxin [Collinsella intestinalis]